MSRVDEALRRARELAPAPPAGEYPAEGPRPVREPRMLDAYQREETPAVRPLAPSVRPPLSARQNDGMLHDANVQPSVSGAYEGKLVTGPHLSAVSVEQYRRL